jgi:membrane protease YdiL (CAAX protease family)
LRLSTVINFALFIGGANLLIGLGPILQLHLNIWFIIIIQAAIAGYFLIKKSALFSHSLYFLLLSLSFLITIFHSIWVLNLLISLAAYLGLIFAVPGLKKYSNWLKFGKFNRRIVFAILLVAIVGSLALVSWYEIFKPDLQSFIGELTDINKSILPMAMAGFAIFNAVGEELVFRGIFWDGLKNIFDNTWAILILQAAFFGLCHYRGFPRGGIGIGLAAIYGGLLGFLKINSKGLAAPVAAHIIADLTIIIIAFYSADMI